jgi:hypothetical protein
MGHLLSLGAACVFMGSLVGCIGITSSGNDGSANLASKTTGDGTVGEQASTKEADDDSGKTEGKVCDKRDHEEVEGTEGRDSSEVGEPPETDEVETPEPTEAPETEANAGDDRITPETEATEGPEATESPEVADASAGTR